MNYRFQALICVICSCTFALKLRPIDHHYEIKKFMKNSIMKMSVEVYCEVACNVGKTAGNCCHQGKNYDRILVILFPKNGGEQLLTSTTGYWFYLHFFKALLSLDKRP